MQSAEMRRIDQDHWRPAGIDQLEPNAWDALRHDGSSCVVAGPGAGKTEYLAQRADYLLTTALCPNPQRILAISFKRDAARNLGMRLSARTPAAAGRFESMTFDAFTKSLVDRFRAALPAAWQIGRDYEVVFPNARVVSGFLDDLSAGHPDRAAEIAALPRSGFIAETVGTFPLPLERVSDPPIGALASLAWWDGYFGSQESRKVDFVMLNRLAELLVRVNPAIHRALVATYPYVFVDEFQDTTFAQYSFLRTVFGGGRTFLTVVGDDKQRIMGWAGALDDAFVEFEGDFSAERFQLQWNFRSSPAMTELHNVVAKTLEHVATPTISQVDAAIDGRPAEIWHFDNARDEARCVAEWIHADCAASGRSPDRYAMLARQKTVDLQPLLQAELARFEIPLRNDDGLVGELRLQDLLADEFVVLMLNIMRLAASEGGGADAWVKVSAQIARMHERAADSEVPSRAQRALETFLCRLRIWMRRNPPSPYAIDRAVDETLSYLGMSAIRSTFLVHRQDAYLARTIRALKVRLDDVYESGVSWEELSDRAEGRGAVPLLTVHKSKGLEYHTVIFLSLDDDQWWSFRGNPDEGVRTFFVGLSRAEQRMIFTYCSARGGRTNIASLYDFLSSGEVAEVWPE